jgi:CheY-like chemotaxis protein
LKASRLAVVIEDDADIRQVIVTLLEATGLEVYSASNGTDGVAAVRQHNPDVVTLDLSLPDIDGLEVAHRIRAFSDAYIVMLTARATEVATLQGLASGRRLRHQALPAARTPSPCGIAPAQAPGRRRATRAASAGGAAGVARCRATHAASAGGTAGVARCLAGGSACAGSASQKDDDGGRLTR